VESVADANVKRQNVVDAQTTRNDVGQNESLVDVDSVVETNVDRNDEAFVSNFLAC
jgi:hypothetical protein